MKVSKLLQKNIRWLFLLAVAVYWWPSSIYAAPVTLTPQEYETLSMNLTELATINARQQSRIEQLDTKWNIARLSTEQSKIELMKAKEQLNEQARHLSQATKTLQEQEKTLHEQAISLEKANQSLAEQERELKQVRRSHKRSHMMNLLLAMGLVYMAKH